MFQGCAFMESSQLTLIGEFKLITGDAVKHITCYRHQTILKVFKAAYKTHLKSLLYLKISILNTFIVLKC